MSQHLNFRIATPNINFRTALPKNQEPKPNVQLDVQPDTDLDVQLDAAPQGKSHGPVIDAIWNFPGQAIDKVKDVASGIIESMPATQLGKSSSTLKEIQKMRDAGASPADIEAHLSEMITPFREQLKKTSPTKVVSKIATEVDPTGTAQSLLGLGEMFVEDVRNRNFGGATVDIGLGILPFGSLALAGRAARRANVPPPPVPKPQLQLSAAKPHIVTPDGITIPSGENIISPDFLAARAAGSRMPGTTVSPFDQPGRSDISTFSPVLPRERTFTGSTADIPAPPGDIGLGFNRHTNRGPVPANLPDIEMGQLVESLPERVQKAYYKDGIIAIDKYNAERIPSDPTLAALPSMVRPRQAQTVQGSILNDPIPIPEQGLPGKTVRIAGDLTPDELIQLRERQSALPDLADDRVFVTPKTSRFPQAPATPEPVPTTLVHTVFDTQTGRAVQAFTKKVMADKYITRKNAIHPNRYKYEAKQEATPTVPKKGLLGNDIGAIAPFEGVGGKKTPIIKKGKDFDFDGNWEVTYPDDRKYSIYKDTSSSFSNWLVSGLEDVNGLSGFTKKELLSKLDNLDESLPAIDKYTSRRGKTIAETLGRKVPDIHELNAGIPIGEKELKRLLDFLMTSGRVRKTVAPLPRKLTPIDTSTPAGKIIQAIRDIDKDARVQAQITQQELGQAFAKSKGVKTKGVAGFYQRLGALSREHETIQAPPLKLSDKAFGEISNEIFSRVDESIDYPERLRIAHGLDKMRKGQIPPPNEVLSIENFFGKEVATEIRELHAGLPIPKIKYETWIRAANSFKSTQASIDLSAPFRQGLGLVHTKEYRQSIKPMLEALKSEEAYQKYQKAINEDSLYQFAEDSSLHISELGKNMLKREEQFAGSFVDDIPGIRHSSRAYITFLNKLRFDTFKSLISEAEKAGLDPKGNKEFAKGVADYVNNATGRGNAKIIVKNAELLNALFFSPRFIASRINTFNPKNYSSATPAFIRKQYWKSLGAMAGAGTTVLALGKLAGGEISTDSNSSAFAKVRFGNTLLDPWGGYQQFFVALSRLRPDILGGGKITTLGNREFTLGNKYGSPTKETKAIDFVANKFSPAASFIRDWYFNTKDFRGKPIDEQERLVNAILPIFIQDMADIYKEDPDLFPLAIPALFGMGVQTFNNKQSLGKDIADFIPGKSLIPKFIK